MLVRSDNSNISDLTDEISAPLLMLAVCLICVTTSKLLSRLLIIGFSCFTKLYYSLLTHMKRIAFQISYCSVKDVTVVRLGWRRDATDDWRQRWIQTLFKIIFFLCVFKTLSCLNGLKNLLTPFYKYSSEWFPAFARVIVH